MLSSALSLRLGGAALLLLAAAAPAAAAEPQRNPADNVSAESGGGAPATAAQPAATAVKPKLICRREESMSGSNLPGKKICLTAAQWRARRD